MLRSFMSLNDVLPKGILITAVGAIASIYAISRRQRDWPS